MDEQIYNILIETMGEPETLLQKLTYQKMAATTTEEQLLIESVCMELQNQTIPKRHESPSSPPVRQFINQMRKKHPYHIKSATSIGKREG